VDRRQLQIFVSLLLSYAAKEANPNKVFELGQKLTDSGVTFVSVEPPLETEEEPRTPSARRKPPSGPTPARWR